MGGVYLLAAIEIHHLVMLVGIMAIVIFAITEQKKRNGIKRAAAIYARRVEEAQLKMQSLRTVYSEEYEKRKLKIGNIKCSQCEWSGQWGAGMSYEKFFASDLAGHEVEYGLLGEKNSRSFNNRQYVCPVCQSTNWEKA